MPEGLAIVTGFGLLSEEVMAEAKVLPDYTRCIIKPWLPRLSNPLAVLYGVFGRSNEAVAIDPFRFSDIEHILVNRQIRRVFFTGDFPRDRYLQMYFTTKIWGDIGRVADEKCLRYISATDPQRSYSVRYFIALNQLLSDSGVTPLLASEIFPQLNPPVGQISNLAPPPDVMERLAAVIVSVANQVAASPREQTRICQAAIIDGGIVALLETSGTNNLIRRYQHGKFIKRRNPYLLKMPSMEFNPALDQPTIGPDTIDGCADANIKGIIVCAETTTIANLAVTMQRVNDRGLFLYAVPLNEVQKIYSERFPNTWMQNLPTAERRPRAASPLQKGA